MLGQRKQHGSECIQPQRQQVLSQRRPAFSEMESDCTLVAPLATLDQAVEDKPINKPHCARVGKLKYASQFIVGWTKPIANNDQGGRRFSRMVQNRPRDCLDAIRDSKPDSP